MPRQFTEIWQRWMQTGARPGDSDEVRVRKRYLLLMAMFILPAGILWGAIYWAFGERDAALLPWTYSLLSVVSIAVFAATGNYAFFRLFQLALILIIPFVLGLLLGGFVSSSAVVLWSLLAPVGGLIFYGTRPA